MKTIVINVQRAQSRAFIVNSQSYNYKYDMEPITVWSETDVLDCKTKKFAPVRVVYKIETLPPYKLGTSDWRNPYSQTRCMPFSTESNFEFVEEGYMLID